MDTVYLKQIIKDVAALAVREGRSSIHEEMI